MREFKSWLVRYTYNHSLHGNVKAKILISAKSKRQAVSRGKKEIKDLRQVYEFSINSCNIVEGGEYV